jgi:hypothetical protein
MLQYALPRGESVRSHPPDPAQTPRPPDWILPWPGARPGRLSQALNGMRSSNQVRFPRGKKSAVCAMLPYRVIRKATAEDWSVIWPILREVGTAGETLTWDSARTEARARSGWMREPPGRTIVAVDDGGSVIGSANTYPIHPGPGHILPMPALSSSRRRVVVAAGEAGAVDWVAEPEAKAFGRPCRSQGRARAGGTLGPACPDPMS